MSKAVFFSEQEIQKLITEAIRLELRNSTQSKPENEKIIYNLSEAANYLSMSKHTVRKYAKLGKIKAALTMIRGYRFHRKELDRFADSYRPHK